MNKLTFVVNKDKLQTTMSRTFDAPRELVWKAYLDPKLIEQWWGPRKFTTKVETLEVKVGGAWKFINKKEGEEHVFFGEFRELEEPERITWTFNYEPYPNTEIVETMTLEELPDGKTKITTLSNYPSIETLEGMIQSGMEQGASESWDRLSEILVTMKK